jgi:hypothetical protein
MNLTTIDLQALINAPESMVVKFFELFEVEDTVNFENQRTYEL